LFARLDGFQEGVGFLRGPRADQVVQRVADAICEFRSDETGALLQQAQRRLVQRNPFAPCEIADFTLQLLVDPPVR
jgi:hypothetical protein